MSAVRVDSIAVAVSRLAAGASADMAPRPDEGQSAPGDEHSAPGEQERLLHSIATLGHVGAEAVRQQHDAVLAAREAGLSWSRIGVGLGITRQAAQQRFSGDAHQELSGPDSRLVGAVTRSDEVQALAVAGRERWKLVASRFGEHTVVRSDVAWEVRRVSVFTATRLPSERDGWVAASTRFPDFFFVRPLVPARET